MTFDDNFPKVAMPQINIPRFEMPRIKSAAEWAYERIANMVKDFEDGLEVDEEIGLRLIATPDTSVMHIDDIGYWGPDMLIYYGINDHGKPMKLVQHNTQMSILLTAVPKAQEKPRRIGFHLMEKVKNEDNDD